MDAKTLCLGALMHGAASGYEIRQSFETGPFSAFHPVGYGSIYPALSALLAEGLVTVREEEQSGRPDKKVYSLTEKGRTAFVRALYKPPQPDKFRSDMLFLLFFAPLLPREHCSSLLDDYIRVQQENLETLAGCYSAEMPPGARFVWGYGQAIYETTLRYFVENRSLLEMSCRDAEEKTAG